LLFCLCFLFILRKLNMPIVNSKQIEWKDNKSIKDYIKSKFVFIHVFLYNTRIKEQIKGAFIMKGKKLNNEMYYPFPSFKDIKRIL
jgi:hypothetical protein